VPNISVPAAGLDASPRASAQGLSLSATPLARLDRAAQTLQSTSIADLDADQEPLHHELFNYLATHLSYLLGTELAIVRRAFALAARAHEGQYRDSGEPYITHPVAVAVLLGNWHLDYQTIAAALLHDVVEDTGISLKTLSESFGSQVADLVDGVSKLDKLEYASREAHQAANFRKMLLAMARDVRVVLIKLADRLHNMRTLDAVSQEKRTRVARETHEIYAPIAYRLGLASLFNEFEDLSLKMEHPNRYAVLEREVAKVRAAPTESREQVIKSVVEKLTEFGVLNAQVTSREKHLHSIYKKMQDRHVRFSDVLDLHGFRIVVDTLPQCYLALGALHALYKPIPEKFKDHIALAKPNGYQSLHSKVYGPNGQTLEFQVRTHEMHRVAESGIAAHWLYKSDQEPLTAAQLKTLQWLQSLLDLQGQSADEMEFLEHVKVDLFPHHVWVFSPKGRIYNLARGATVIDFAYSVHTNVGNHAISGIINGETVPLSAVVNNGDRVEVVTDPQSAPNPVWLSFVTTGKARSHIRHELKKRHINDATELGELLLVRALNSVGADPNQLSDELWRRFLRSETDKSREDILADIGLGKRLAVVVARRLASVIERQHERPATSSHLGAPKTVPGLRDSLVIRGSEGIALQMCSVCRPIPGDTVIAQIKKGQGLLVHTVDCALIKDQSHEDAEKWIDVEWDTDEQLNGRLFNVNVLLTAANQRGVLAQLASTIAEAEANIEHFAIEEKSSDAYTSILFTLQVRSTLHLEQVLRSLSRLPQVTRVTRMKARAASETSLGS
jgi:GTP diphosphokinase / guanosine-3',5'-bis(diphosphate) 3'-diphosphatase